MSGSKSSLGVRLLFLFGLLFTGARLLGARNAVTWNFLAVPEKGSVGLTIQFGASVTNSGEVRWGSAHYLEMSDQNGVRLDYIALSGTDPGATKTVVFELDLPVKPGLHSFRFTTLEHGREYFGPSLPRAIMVRLPPLSVSLTLDDATIAVGERARLLSVAGPVGEVAGHGLETRPIGGIWQKWVEWRKGGGDPQIAFVTPEGAGISEWRAFAVRTEDGETTYSNRALLVVIVVAPVITAEPVGAIVNVGERVTLTVGATGSAPLYQWRKDGVEIAGATNATLTLAPAQVGQSGGYSVLVANSGGTASSRIAAVAVNPLNLPAMRVEVSSFAGGGPKRTVDLAAAKVGDVVSVGTVANLTAGTGWRHNVLVRRPAVTSATALAPEDGSGLTAAHEAWNKDGWGSPHDQGDSYDPAVTGRSFVDLGNREPFIHALTPGQAGSSRAIDFVLDAPGAWLIRAEVVDGAGQLIATSAVATVNVGAPAMAGDPANLTYPYGRGDRFVGVFWNAGQAHRLWSTWRADFQSAYPATWAMNWKLMWQPSPYFRRVDGGWLQPNLTAESPWQPFWSAHQVYALVPDGAGGSVLSHDLTSRSFAEKAALRLMDVGVDFVVVDYTNQFLEEREDVFPAVNNLALAFQSVARQSQTGERIRLAAVVPANVDSGDWGGNGGFDPVAIARFNAKLTTLYNRFARFEPAWFYLEDDNGGRKPLLLLWIGASGEGEPDGKLAPAKLSQLRLADGRAMTDVFTIRWVGAYLSDNRRFLTGATYTVAGADGPVTGKYANAKTWSYHESFPAAASVAPGAAGSGAAPNVEAVTVQPLAAGRDRFGRVWEQNWPAGQGYHYETAVTNDPVPLAAYGRIWRDALQSARALNPKFLLTSWAEFGSENDEPRPELSVTIMDNNKFGTHFGDAFKAAVRLFKYQAPTAWIDTLGLDGVEVPLAGVAAAELPVVRSNQAVRLQGWVTPNVATTFAGGSVKIYVNEVVRGAAVVGGAWNGATRWQFDLPVVPLGIGRHTVKVVVEDGVGGNSLAGVQFRGEPPRNNFTLVVVAP
ncbi:MAG: hypothetical protein EXS37_10465 [Opitutus sp.]|nr:hypothetical protein [Opitutus sp.]